MTREATPRVVFWTLSLASVKGDEKVNETPVLNLDEVVDPLSLEVSEVTGSRTLEVDQIDGHRTSADLARTMAAMLDLPENQPYALRDEDSQRMLLDDHPIGSQVSKTTRPRLTVIPKARLGA